MFYDDAAMLLHCHTRKNDTNTAAPNSMFFREKVFISKELFIEQKGKKDFSKTVFPFDTKLE
jgi:hypothetical protein